MSILPAPLSASTDASEDFRKPFVGDNGASASGSSTSLRLPNQFRSNGQGRAAMAMASGGGGSSGGGTSVETSNSGGRRPYAKGKDGVLNPLAQEFIPGSSTTFPGEMAGDHCCKALSAESSSLMQNINQDRTGSHTNFQSVMPKENAEDNQDSYALQILHHSGEDNTVLQMARIDQGRAGVSRSSKGESDFRSSQHSSIGLPSGSRRGQTSNANHLLNFRYNPITRVPARPTARRQHKNQPYNKEHFLQANFRFLVSDLGDYVINASDPDKMLLWEDVAAVECSTSKGIHCPICLENPPICSQITSCGHIFCFPCILRYFLAGEDITHGDLWKKCPVCVAMIYSKDLRSVFLDTVNEYQRGENISFTLLTRAKDSIIPLRKNEFSFGSFPHSKTGRCHPYSKLTLTSDMEEITNRAIVELTHRAKEAQTSGGEDLDQIQYIFAAIDQLNDRQGSWIERRSVEFLSSSPPIRQRILAQARKGLIKPPASFEKAEMTSFGGDADLKKGKGAVQQQPVMEKVDVSFETQAAMATLKEKSAWVYENAFSDDEDATSLRARLGKSMVLSQKRGSSKGLRKSQPALLESGNVPAEWEQLIGLSPESDQDMQNAGENEKMEEKKKDNEEKDSYTFYQSSDGQLIILHPLNMKCLLQHYGDYDFLPPRIDAKIFELETVSQSESMRRRYRFLSHLPLTATIQLCEVDLSGFLPEDAFAPFAEELHFRELKRWHRQKREEEQRIIEEKMAAAETRARNFIFPAAATFEDENATNYSDFPGISGDSENLGISPPMEGRELFSNVTRLGFAAGYDAPALGMVSSVPVAAPIASLDPSAGGEFGAQQTSSTRATGESNKSSMSFADVIQLRTGDSQQHNGSGQGAVAVKKGKKSSKIIMSTAGGRRY